MSDLSKANVELIYKEVTNAFHRIDEFRARLLGLLPLFSGAGIFVLLDPRLVGSIDAAAGRSMTGAPLPAVGLFGLFVTLGLYIYELAGIRRCNLLIRLGRWLEGELGVVGSCTIKPTGKLIGATRAGFTIYATVVAGWAFLAASPLGAMVAARVAIAAGLALFLSSQVLDTCKLLDPEFDPDVKTMLTTRVAGASG